MDQNDFFSLEAKNDAMCNKGYLIYDFHIVNVVEVFIKLKWKARYKYFNDPFQA